MASAQRCSTGTLATEVQERRDCQVDLQPGGRSGRLPARNGGSGAQGLSVASAPTSARVAQLATEVQERRDCQLERQEVAIVHASLATEVQERRDCQAERRAACGPVLASRNGGSGAQGLSGVGTCRGAVGIDSQRRFRSAGIVRKRHNLPYTTGPDSQRRFRSAGIVRRASSGFRISTRSSQRRFRSAGIVSSLVPRKGPRGSSISQRRFRSAGIVSSNEHTRAACQRRARNGGSGAQGLSGLGERHLLRVIAPRNGGSGAQGLSDRHVRLCLHRAGVRNGGSGAQGLSGGPPTTPLRLPVLLATEVQERRDCQVPADPD